MATLRDKMGMPITLRLLLLLLLAAGLSARGMAQTYDTLKICTYNVLNYPPSDTSKNSDFRKIMREIAPDILVLQEMNSAAGVTQFLNNVLNAVYPGTYAAAPYSTDSSDNAMFYRTSRVSYISPVQIIHTEPRHINGYRLRPAGISSDSIDLQIYSMHLKASQGSDNELRRAVAAESLRTRLNSLPDGGFFIGAGDLNLYTSAEAAWTNLTGSQGDNSGRLYDPLNRVGSWSDNPSFADVHTQSTRTELLGDGGATGGLDDRFDFILLSYTFPNPAGWDYVNGSYTEYGNDGNHLNLSVNYGVNSAVPDSIADALWRASDHLPVFLRVRRQVIPPATITVTWPNGAETLYTGNLYDLTWASQYLTGTVTLRLNRSFPSAAWDTIVTGTANDGSHLWLATGPASTAARLQVVSDLQPWVRDSSDSDFTIRLSRVNLLTPEGGEDWIIGETRAILWTSEGITGNVCIELNRSYPVGRWDTLFAATPNDGSELWPVVGPPTDSARIRVSSLVVPAARDTSAHEFSILHSNPPVIVHDRHGDGEPGPTVFTARITDDFGVASAALHYRLAGSPAFDSTAMLPTVYPHEYADTVVLGFGRYDYFIRTFDSEGQSSTTDTFEIALAAWSKTVVGYDDGSAELYNWSQPDSFRWAVRFTPPAVPFLLGELQIGVAGFHPDTAHTPLRVSVRAADGPDGMPGTVLREVVRGSVGNMVGGLPGPGLLWATVVLHDQVSEPLSVSDDFYVAVENTGLGAEAFAMDTSSANAGRSLVFDPCEQEWFAEDGSFYNSRDGNRMVRVRGWSGRPEELVIRAIGNDIRLSWRSNGAPYYRTYKASAFGGALEFVASTPDTTLLIPGAVPEAARTYYEVVSSSSP